MFIKRGVMVVLCAVVVLLVGCSPKSSDIVVLQVGQTKVSLAEYENFFARNSGGWDAARKSTPAEREHFLDLLTDYRLKLQDAYDRNLASDSEIVGELREYRTSLASTFLIEHEITEPGIKQLYDRKREEIRARHILLRIAPDAPPEETLKVYSRAMDIIKQLKAGERFDSLAFKYSEDPASKPIGGDVYYFTGGVMYAPLENAAYAMHKGEISASPVRTPFGYHILEITDRQPTRGLIKVSHIMARFQSLPSPDSADTASALARIRAIQDSLKHGWDFHKLAVKLSEDAGSAPKGGDLGWFERRQFVEPFDEAAFLLKPGQISPITRTPYGYHLILCDSAKPLPPLTDPKYAEDLQKEYQQRRYNDDYNAYVAQMKRDFHYSFNENVFNQFAILLDSTKTTGDSGWANSVPTSLRSQVIMMVHDRPITLDTVITLLEKRQEYQNVLLRAKELRSSLDRISDMFLFEAKSDGLELRYPEFASLMKEYADGILLYKAEQTEVWNKTTVTDSALKAYYAENASEFMFPQRVTIGVIEAETDTLAYLLYDSLKHGADFDKLALRYPENPNLQPKDSSRVMQPVDTDALTKRAATLKVGEYSEPVEQEAGGMAIVKLLAQEPARQKTFEEAGAEVSNAYQEHTSKVREQEWLESIRLKHPVKQFKEALKDAFRSPEALK